MTDDTKLAIGGAINDLVFQAGSTHLDRLAAAHWIALEAAFEERAAATLARKDGATWEQIGAALGTTKQAAQQRFSWSAAAE